MTSFVDYAWWQVSPAQLASMGFTGAMRYGTPHNTKSATPAEVSNLRAAGFDFGLVFESTAGRSTQGSQAGHDDGLAANAYADSLGYPKTCTLWYAVDFDGEPAQVQSYFDGIGSAGGRPFAPYGSDKICDGVRYSAKYAWQTAAWSGGRVSARAGLLQNGFHDTYDSNRVLVPDFGQWRAHAPAPSPSIPAHVLEEGMYSVPPDGKPHDYPIPTWVKVVTPVSTGCQARAQIGNGKDWPVVHEKDFWGNNTSFRMAKPDGMGVFGATNWGPNELNVVYDIA